MAGRLLWLALAVASVLTLVALPVREANGATIDWLVTISPSTIHAGETIHIDATPYAQGGIPQYTLHLDEQESPVVRLDSPTSIHTPTLPETVGWDLTALRPGTQTFHVSVSYETACPGSPPPCFLFEFASSPTYTITVAGAPGDADCDGALTSIDALLSLQSDAGLIAVLACTVAIDPNGDGQWDAIDASLILQYVAGLIPGFA